MDEYKLALYLWGSLSAVAVALPTGLVVIRSALAAWERHVTALNEHAAPSLHSSPLPSHPSWAG